MDTSTRTLAGPVRGGWIRVAAAFVMLTLNTGFGFYALGSFSRSYVANTGISLTAASAGATIFLLANGLGGIPIARWMPRIGRRSVIVGGAVVSAGCLAVLGACTQAWQLWLLYLVYGLFSAGYQMVPASAMVLDWYADRGPARPLALAAAGFSVGGAVVTPVVTAAVDGAGLTVAGIGMAIVLLLLVVPLGLFASGGPARRPVVERIAAQGGPAEAGDPENGDSPRGVGAAGSAPVSAAGTSSVRRALVIVSIAFGLLMLSQVAAVTHMLTLGQERGVANVTLAVSVIAATSVAGRVLGIVIMPHVNLRLFSITMAALQVTSLVVIGTAHSLPQLLLGAVLMGLTVGNNQVLIPLWVLDIVGLPRYAEVFARVNLVVSLGVAVSPLLIGVVHDAAGDYVVPFLMAAVGSAVAGVLVSTLRPRETA